MHWRVSEMSKVVLKVKFFGKNFISFWTLIERIRNDSVRNKKVAMRNNTT